jgi:hypothetical protein
MPWSIALITCPACMVPLLLNLSNLLSIQIAQDRIERIRNIRNKPSNNVFLTVMSLNPNLVFFESDNILEYCSTPTWQPIGIGQKNLQPDKNKVIINRQTERKQ